MEVCVCVCVCVVWCGVVCVLTVWCVLCVVCVCVCVCVAGLAILLPFLISHNRVWKKCKLRVFIASVSRNIDQGKLRFAFFQIHYLHICV